MSNDSHLFKLARASSKLSDYKSGCSSARVGCVVAYKGTVLSKGFNSDKTHTTQARYNKWRYKDNGNNYLPQKLHSEIKALEAIKYLDINFSKVHIYIYRELKDGTMALSRPCPSCMARIKEMGIKNIHYTTADGFCHEKLEV